MCFVETAGGKFDDGFNLFAIETSYHSMMSSTLALASRFAKMANTGIRVPFNTHAPLTLPGTLSIAEHCDQSSAAIEGTPASG
jgi:hypothetical protein